MEIVFFLPWDLKEAKFGLTCTLNGLKTRQAEKSDESNRKFCRALKRAFLGRKKSSSRELSCTFIRIDKRISRVIQKKRTLNNVHFPVAEVDGVLAIFIYGHSISTLYRLDSVKLDNYWFSTLTQLDNVRAQQQSISFHIFIQRSLFVR